MPKSIFSEEYRVFRELLRERRMESGLTQVHLSGALGMAQSFVSKYEMGERRLDFVEVAKICKALGSDLTEFSAAYRSRLAKLKKNKTKRPERRAKS